MSHTSPAPPVPLLETQQLGKRFVRRRLWHPAAVTQAVDDVSFAISEGESFGLVGESGSGKTTVARCILRLTRPTSGDVRLDGESIYAMTRTGLRGLRRAMQPVFQDPYSSLNPRRTVGQSVAEPLVVHHIGTPASRRARVAELLDLVGLDPAYGGRRPDALSGGQRQRIALARALALRPRLLVLDEPVSSLDASVAAQIINLLMRLRADLRLALLFISHDLRLVRHLTTRVAVMKTGRIVETGATDALFATPHHPYTRELVSAAGLREEHGQGQSGEDAAAASDAALPLREVATAHWARV